MNNYKIFILPVFSLLVLSCTGNKDDGEKKLDRETRVQLRQMLTVGKQLYLQYCANCHMEDGSGFKELYPPLKNADYMKEDLNRTVCIIKNGQKGSIVVNGEEYNQLMPNNLGLSNLEIATITTYIYNRFADSTMVISAPEVDKILQQCDLPVVY